MSRKIAPLFGGRKRAPDPDPLPGEGGYHLPRGPYGEGGYPGSAPAAPDTHSQQPGDGDKRELYTASGNQELWDETGGQIGGMPGRYVGGQLPRTRDTTTRRRPIISGGVPGSENVRNEVAQRYKNPPGHVHLYQSSPNPGMTRTRRRGQEEAVQPVAVENRYEFDFGGNEVGEVDREIPYAFIHARPHGYSGAPSVRGADLSGDRYYEPGVKRFITTEGQYGRARRAGPRHRPTTFQQPIPWSANYYDTSVVDNSQAANTVYVSPIVPRSRKAGQKRGG